MDNKLGTKFKQVGCNNTFLIDRFADDDNFIIMCWDEYDKCTNIIMDINLCNYLFSNNIWIKMEKETLNKPVGTKFQYRENDKIEEKIYTIDSIDDINDEVLIVWDDDDQSKTIYPIKEVNKLFEEETWIEVKNDTKKIKYKIIKTFPNQNNDYKIGDVISECGYKGLFDIAKDWPEYFEELEEIVYPKIITFGIPSEHLYTHINKDKYQGRAYIKVSFSSLIAAKTPIYQVAISPDTFLTIGDTVKYENNPLLILNIFGFEYEPSPYDKENKTGVISIFHDHTLLGKWLDFSKIQKVKQLFVTEDNVKIFEGDKVFGVLPKANWQTNYYGGEGIPIEAVLSKYDSKSPWKYFSIKEAAEKYKYDNMPIFSRKQVLEFKGASYTEFINTIK